MKRITIGRSTGCDVVIADETDNVSRKHLVISFDFLGRMRISDTSSNGTFINGVRMIKGASIPVTKNDKIRLGNSTDLDWALINDPYRKTRIIALVALIVVVVAGIVVGGWLWYKDRNSGSDTPKIELLDTTGDSDDAWNKDSTSKVAPIATSIDVEGKKNAAKTKKVSGSKKKTAKKAAENKSVPKSMYHRDYASEKSVDEAYVDSVAAF